ncbi:hypothetical protein MTsPCn9_10810 [Croceitalea sp. MTPC9]|nr:hypothetical protein MTsPCn6_26430 [Croceitalea sp. MTPC6]GMN16145.1 hypothetical protein MTsPCn9_10810 [Croceitalea sp. MTPC9]
MKCELDMEVILDSEIKDFTFTSRPSVKFGSVTLYQFEET